MLEVVTRRCGFTKRSFWFAESPFDVDSCSAAFFYAVQHPEVEGFASRRRPTMLIDLSEDLDVLWGRMGKSCRWNLNRAVRDGVTVEKNRDHRAFYRLYRDFVWAKGFEGRPEDFWAHAEKGTLYTWYLNETLYGGLLALENESSSRWHMSGSRRLAERDPKLSKIIGRGNRRIVWEVIVDAKQRGMRWFDLGGYYDGPDPNDPRANITAFKEEFGAQRVERYDCWKYYSKLYRLVKSLVRRP